jgi:hypothetical protein
MFDRPDDHHYLQARLEAFITHWHGWRSPWFGIAAEKIEQTQLPQPLAWLYGFAGEWHGRYYWDKLLGNQDCLISFEDLAVRNGKLVFVSENQAVWQVGTESAGEDPPVWACFDNGPWQPLDASLTQFLVTFVLHETVLGCQHVGKAHDALERLTAAGMHLSPLWLDHPYPSLIDGSASRPLSFHVANGTHLVMNNHWCATNAESPWVALPSIFKPKEKQKSSGGLDPYEPIPDHIQLPSFIRRSHLENAIRLHEAEAEYHEQRCKLYRKMMIDLDAGNTS